MSFFIINNGLCANGDTQKWCNVHNLTFLTVLYALSKVSLKTTSQFVSSFVDWTLYCYVKNNKKKTYKEREVFTEYCLTCKSGGL